jgi:hypothetical protein
MMTADDIRRIMHVEPYRLPVYRRVYETVCDWLSVSPRRGLTVAILACSAFWWLVIWALLDGYKRVGR